MASRIKYTVVNPYAEVDWDSWDYYKANLHTHCTASDGRIDLPDMVDRYYKLGYDILAMTDHGVINNGWDKDRKVHPPFNLFQKLTKVSPYDYKRMTEGSDRNGRGMTDLKGGIELNMFVLSKTHVNAFFTDYGSGIWGRENDYATITEAVEKHGKGCTVLNHTGDWMRSNHHPERAHSPMFIEYFANIFVNNPSCLGMEIINNNDNVTKADKALWDELLKVVIPKGRNVIGFANDDSEYPSDIGNSFEMFLLPENTEKNIRKAMYGGCLFACGRFAKTDMGDDFEGTGEVPLVKRIDIDGNIISLTPDESRDCKVIEWIADGRVIAEGMSINLSEHENELGCYIRFQMKGEGGITYSQAFELKYDSRKDCGIPHWDSPETKKSKIINKFIHTRVFGAYQFLSGKRGADMLTHL